MSHQNPQVNLEEKEPSEKGVKTSSFQIKKLSNSEILTKAKNARRAKDYEKIALSKNKSISQADYKTLLSGLENFEKALNSYKYSSKNPDSKEQIIQKWIDFFNLSLDKPKVLTRTNAIEGLLKIGILKTAKVTSKSKS